MEDRKKSLTDKYKEITNEWNYDANGTLTSFLVWGLENFKRLVFVAELISNEHTFLSKPTLL